MDAYNLKFDVYRKDIKVGRVELHGNEVVKNEIYFTPKDYAFPFMINPFINMKTGVSIRRYLSLRAVPHEKANITKILNAMGLKEYNVYDMLEINHGVKCDDFLWFKFDGVPDDGKTWEDLNPWRRI